MVHVSLSASPHECSICFVSKGCQQSPFNDSVPVGRRLMLLMLLMLPPAGLSSGDVDQ